MHFPLQESVDSCIYLVILALLLGVIQAGMGYKIRADFLIGIKTNCSLRLHMAFIVFRLTRDLYS